MDKHKEDPFISDNNKKSYQLKELLALCPKGSLAKTKEDSEWLSQPPVGLEVL